MTIVAGEERRERRIRFDQVVPERLRDAQPDAVAAGRRHREPAGRQHHAIALENSA